MPADIPPNLAQTGSAAIVRHAEDQRKAQAAEKKRLEVNRRRREEAMRDAAAQRRIQGKSK